jgi:hypothetical protein
VTVFWRYFLGLIVIVLIGSLIAGQQNAEQSSAVRSQYEREISTTFDALPLPSGTRIVEPELQEAYRVRTSPGSGFVVKAQYERPGRFAETLNAYRTELAIPARNRGVGPEGRAGPRVLRVARVAQAADGGTLPLNPIRWIHCLPTK